MHRRRLHNFLDESLVYQNRFPLTSLAVLLDTFLSVAADGAASGAAL